MGSDLYMESMHRPCPPPPPLSEQAKSLEDKVAMLEERIGKVIAEKVALEEQSRRDAASIAQLTRERDRALAQIIDLN
jgi:hypothetical protein